MSGKFPPARYWYFVLFVLVHSALDTVAQDRKPTLQVLSSISPWPKMDAKTIRELTNAYQEFFIQESRHTSYVDYQASEYSWIKIEYLLPIIEEILPVSSAENNYGPSENGTNCVFGGWFSRQQPQGKCVPPWYAKKRAKTQNFSPYGPPCGHPDLFRCNPTLFGPGPSKEEATQMKMPSGSGHNNHHNPQAGICVETKISYQGLTQKCAQAEEQLAKLRNNRHWQDSVSDGQLQTYLHDQLQPLANLVQQYCQTKNQNSDPCQHLAQKISEIFQKLAARKITTELHLLPASVQVPPCDETQALEQSPVTPPSPVQPLPQEQCAPGPFFNTPSGKNLYQLLIKSLLAADCVQKYPLPATCQQPIITWENGVKEIHLHLVDTKASKAATYPISLEKFDLSSMRSEEDWKKLLQDQGILQTLCQQDAISAEKISMAGENNLTAQQKNALRELGATFPAIHLISVSTLPSQELAIKITPAKDSSLDAHPLQDSLIKIFGPNNPDNLYTLKQQTQDRSDGSISYQLIPKKTPLCDGDKTTAFIIENGDGENVTNQISLTAAIQYLPEGKSKLVLSLLNDELNLDYQNNNNQNYRFQPPTGTKSFTLSKREYESLELQVDPKTGACTLRVSEAKNISSDDNDPPQIEVEAKVK